MSRSLLSLYAGFIFTILFNSTNFIYAQWVQTNGYNGTIHSVFISGNTIFAGTNGGGVYRSTNDGTSWSPVDSGLTGLELYVNCFAAIDSNIFAGTRAGIFVSTNMGTNWTEVDSGLTNSLSRYILALASYENKLFAGTQGGGAYLSTNNGLSWAAINSGLQLPYVSSLAIINKNLFAGTQGKGVFLSTNNGSSWKVADSGLVGLAIYSLSVNSTELFTGTNQGLYLSTNNGESWSSADSGIQNLTVTSLIVSGSNLFVGTNDGVWLSTNNAINWTAVDSGLLSLDVQSLTIKGDTLFAGSGGGVWVRLLFEMITDVNQIPSKLPTYFNLEQNYPNPFNPTTTINYSVAKVGLVTIKVYDILGREVTTLINEQKNAGSYDVQFNAAKLASGIYFYRMQSGNFVSTKKFVVLK